MNAIGEECKNARFYGITIYTARERFADYSYQSSAYIFGGLYIDFSRKNVFGRNFPNWEKLWVYSLLGLLMRRLQGRRYFWGNGERRRRRLVISASTAESESDLGP